MLSFKNFLKEDRLRQGLSHIRELPYERLGNFLRKKSINGTITPKTDGAAGLVGYDENGFFTQSGRSDKVRHAGAYSDYTRQKRGENADLTISSSYDAMHDSLQKNKELISYLKKRHESGQPSTIKGEFFLRGLAQPSEKGLKFVATSYNPNAMGSTGMFIMHHKLPENSTHNPDEVSKLSNDEVKFDHDKVGNNNFSIDTSNEHQVYKTINPEILKSRKAIDATKKAEENEKLNNIRNSLESKLKEHIPKLESRSWEVPGETEGHVIHIEGDDETPSGDHAKIQSEKFAEYKANEKLNKQGR